MNRQQFLDALKSGRAEWDALLAQVDPARLSEPGVEGEWSVKDIIAHVTWFEREMIDVLRERALVGSDLWNLPQDEQNAIIFQQNRERSIEDVLAESQTVFQQLWAAAQSLTDEDLVDARRFAGMPADWVPWDLVAGNSFTHYPDHMVAIRAWLGTQAPA